MATPVSCFIHGCDIPLPNAGQLRTLTQQAIRNQPKYIELLRLISYHVKGVMDLAGMDIHKNPVNCVVIDAKDNAANSFELCELKAELRLNGYQVSGTIGQPLYISWYDITE